MTAPLERRVMNLVARGRVRAVSDSATLQRLQVEAFTDEVMDKIERLQEYGFTSVPLDGAECVLVFLGGNRSHGVVVATDDRRTRLKDLASGDVALWNAGGAKLVLKNATKDLEGTIDKLKLQNATGDFVAVLSDLCSWLQSAQVVGNIPFRPADLTALAAIKVRLDTFKG
jgi:phage baseplate assembly protein V